MIHLSYVYSALKLVNIVTLGRLICSRYCSCPSPISFIRLVTPHLLITLAASSSQLQSPPEDCPSLRGATSPGNTWEVMPSVPGVAQPMTDRFEPPDLWLGLSPGYTSHSRDPTPPRRIRLQQKAHPCLAFPPALSCFPQFPMGFSWEYFLHKLLARESPSHICRTRKSILQFM